MVWLSQSSHLNFVFIVRCYVFNFHFLLFIQVLELLIAIEHLTENPRYFLNILSVLDAHDKALPISSKFLWEVLAALAAIETNYLVTTISRVFDCLFLTVSSDRLYPLCKLQ